MKKTFSLGAVASFIYLFLPLIVWGQDRFGLNNALDSANRKGQVISGIPLENVAANIIQVVLGFVGIIFLMLIIYGGFQWMTSSGNEEQISKAKKVITGATLGLIVIVVAYTITYWITTYILQATSTL